MFLTSIELENILSFGNTRLKLEPLNVLIGANAVGKSNLIRTVSLLAALPQGSPAEFSTAGARAWINQHGNGPALVSVQGEYGGESPHFEYEVILRPWKESYEIIAESLEGVFHRDASHYWLRVTDPNAHEISPTQPVLSQVRHPSEPEIGRLSEMLKSMRLYREFRTGPNTNARYGISSNTIGAYLLEDGGNLALVLGELDQHRLLERFNGYLAQLFDRFVRVFVLTRNGITQLY